MTAPQRWAAVATRSRVHHETTVVSPNGLGDERLEHRTQDQLGVVLCHGRLNLVRSVDHGHLDLVTELGERDIRPLAQAVVCGDDEQNPQRSLGNAERRLTAQGRRAATQDVFEMRRFHSTPDRPRQPRP